MEELILKQAPEEEYSIMDKRVIVRREDLRFLPPLPPNMKMEALFELVKRAALTGYKRVVMFAKKQQGTSYAIGLPVFCEMFNITPIIVAPKGENQPIPDWIFDLGKLGPKTELHFIHPNMVSINVNQSKKIANDLNAYFVPFGFDDARSVEAHSRHFKLPDIRIGTLITATMTGMILAGIIDSINKNHSNVQSVIGISGGRSPENIMNSILKYLLPMQVLDKTTILNPFQRNTIISQTMVKPNWPIPLHPDYEAKAWLWMLANMRSLEEPIYFVNAGR